MADLIVSNIDGQLLVDSRLIAERLGIQHKNLLATIKKYADDFKEFGHLAFETQAITHAVSGKTNQEIFAHVNEAQATLLMTYSKNTEQVRRCKLDLVKAFEKAKAIIATVIPAQSDRIKELELELQLRQLDSTMLTLHGAEVVLTLRGLKDQVVRGEVPVTEIVEPVTGRSTQILSADQLKRAVKERTGQNLKTMSEFTSAIKAAGRDDLLIPVTRSNTSEYVIPDKLDEAIAIVYKNQQQRLIGQ